jgi:LmbE family N-acetylglucosaminyl deacetylase
MLLEELSKQRVVLVGAHPDDETIGAGALLARLERPVVVVVTDGAPRDLVDARAAGYESREDYAAARRNELYAAMETAGIAEDQVRMLDVTDQEASCAMAEVARRIADILRELRPGTVLCHPYEGGHPDHDACALATHAACALTAPAPGILEFTSYHARDGSMETGRFLLEEEPGFTLTLSEEMRQKKQAMLKCHATQFPMLRNFPNDVERFRPAPAYDFTAAPHAGKLFYEKFSWGMTGERWRRLAAEAMRELGLPPTL